MHQSEPRDGLQKPPQWRLLSWHAWPIAARALAIVAILLAAAMLALAAVMPDDAALRRRLVAELQQRYEVQVDVRSVSWTLLPAPIVTIRGLHTHQKEPIDIESLRLRPAVGLPLLRGQLAIALLEVDGMRLPTASLRAFRAPRDNGARSSRSGRRHASVGPVLLEKLRLRHLVWVSRTGVELLLNGDVEFDDDYRPRRAEFWRPGFLPATRIRLQRQGLTDSWHAEVELGGGSADGDVALESGGDRLTVTGTLNPRNIDLQTAAAALNRRTAVGGSAHGVTRVGARGTTPGELGSSLRLRTEGVVDHAEVLRVDVDRAIRTLGMQHDGRTKLKSLTGVMDLQNTPDGTVVNYRDIKAEGETFTARARGTVFNRHVAASGELRALGGTVVLPFVVTGPTRDVKVTVPTAVKAGAVAGTVVLPVIGTILGARAAAAATADAPPPDPPPGTPKFIATPLGKTSSRLP